MSDPEQPFRPANQPRNPQPQDSPSKDQGSEGVLDLDPRATPASMEMGAAGQGLGFGTSADFDAEWDAREAALAVPADRAVRPDTTIATEPLLRNVTFRNFWLSRLLSQIGQGALMYALLIIVVDRTDDSFYNSVFVICAIIPSIVFGLPAGVVVDALPRRPMLIGLNLLRFLF